MVAEILWLEAVLLTCECATQLTVLVACGTIGVSSIRLTKSDRVQRGRGRSPLTVRESRSLSVGDVMIDAVYHRCRMSDGFTFPIDALPQ